MGNQPYRNKADKLDAQSAQSTFLPGWLHTGDLCYFDEDGELFVVDRLKELIKYRGHQISPGEIEDVLLSHPAVLEAAVVSVFHPTDDEHPIAYVTKKLGTKVQSGFSLRECSNSSNTYVEFLQVTEQELIDLVASNMMDHFKLRAGVVFLDSFPYTGSGKIAKKELRALARKWPANYYNVVTIEMEFYFQTLVAHI